MLSEIQKSSIFGNHNFINEKVKTQGKFSQCSYISATGFVAFIKPKHCKSATVVF